MNVGRRAERTREGLQVVARRAVTDEHERHVVAPHLFADEPGAADDVVDALLWSHHAHVADQEPAAVLECRVRGDRAEALHVGAAAHDEHIGRPFAAAALGDLAPGFARGDDQVGRRERETLAQRNRAIEQVAPAVVFGEVHLRGDVVLVEDHAHVMAEFVAQRHEKQKVGWVAQVDHVEGPVFVGALGETHARP